MSSLKTSSSPSSFIPTPSLLSLLPVLFLPPSSPGRSYHPAAAARRLRRSGYALLSSGLTWQWCGSNDELALVELSQFVETEPDAPRSVCDRLQPDRLSPQGPAHEDDGPVPSDLSAFALPDELRNPPGIPPGGCGSGKVEGNRHNTRREFCSATPHPGATTSGGVLPDHALRARGRDGGIRRGAPSS